MKKLNIGCGKKLLDGYVNLDSLPLPGVDVIHDLNMFPYPFEDSSFDEIRADNVIEHLDDTVKIFEEIHRILKPGGRFMGIVPYFAHPCAFADPTHKQFFSIGTFDYFCEGFDYNFYTDIRFEIESLELIFGPKFGIVRRISKINKRFYERHISRVFPARGISFILRKI